MEFKELDKIANRATDKNKSSIFEDKESKNTSDNKVQEKQKPKYKILYINTEMGTPHAEYMGAQGHQVYMYIPWQSSRSRFDKYAIGMGLPNIEKVKNWTDVIDKVDFVVTDDTSDSMGGFLRKHGYKTVSAGEGIEIETKRLKSKKILEEIGLMVPPYQHIKGSDNVVAFFKEKLSQKTESSDTSAGNYYVKLNIFRGALETVNIANEASLDAFDCICKKEFGMGRNSIDFIIEEKVKGVETGADCIFSGKDFVRPMMWGFEIDADYVGKFSDTTPFDADLEKLKKYLIEVGYSGPMSFEVLRDGDKNYWIDVACRNPQPLSYIYPHNILNYDTVMYEIANGRTPRLDIKSEYAACCCIGNDIASENWLALNYKKDYNKTKHGLYLFPVTMVDNQKYIIPCESYSRRDVIGAGIGDGDTAEKAIDMALNSCDMLNVWFSTWNGHMKEDLLHNMEELKTKCGIDFNK